MCGRFCLTSPPDKISRTFDLQIPFDLEPRYNIAPGQPILVIRDGDDHSSEAAMLHWGLIPSWAKDRAIGYRTVNARSESITQKPAFRSAYRSRHCLVIADGFYEWATVGRQKRPSLFYRGDGNLFTLAGLWETWTDPAEGETIASCTIITTDANSLVAPVHQRMPVVIEPDNRDSWLDASRDSSGLLPSREWTGFTSRPVASYVNQAGNEGPQCHAPPETDSSLPLFET